MIAKDQSNNSYSEGVEFIVNTTSLTIGMSNITMKQFMIQLKYVILPVGSFMDQK